MTNDKAPGTPGTDTEQSATNGEADDTANPVLSGQDHNLVAAANGSLPSTMDDLAKPDSSLEYVSSETGVDSIPSRSLCAVTKEQLESRSPDTDDNTNENASTNESNSAESSLGYLTSDRNDGATCSSDTIDSGICRSTMSIERSGSFFEHEDKVPELQPNLRVGSDYSYDIRRPSNSSYDSLSDDEIQENYLGNILSHKRRSGVFVCPTPDADDIERNTVEDNCESYIGVKRVRQNDIDNAESNMSFGVKRVPQLKGNQNGNSGALTKIRPERWSKGSMDSAASKAESSVSFSNSLAMHVRKDSIAIGLEKMHKGRPARRRSSVTFADLQGLVDNSKKEINTMTSQQGPSDSEKEYIGPNN